MIGKYSPEIRSYFRFLRNVGFAVHYNPTFATKAGIEHSRELFQKLIEDDEVAAGELADVFGLEISQIKAPPA